MDEPCFSFIINIMTLTPEFNLRQDEDFVYFEIRCPNIKASEIEMIMEGTDFHFFADPYNLTLQFRHKLVDNQNGTASYNLDTGYFNARLQKAIKGEDFPELLLFTTLKPVQKREKFIEVVESNEALTYSDIDPDPTKYGFNFWSTNFFENLNEVIPYVCDIPDPDNIPHPLRKQRKIEKEDEDFDHDKILFDINNPQELNIDGLNPLYEDFSAEERSKLVGIARRQYLMSRNTAKISFNAVADVVYSSLYDAILFGIEGSCESHWTIGKLSSTLSWFDNFDEMSEVILSTLRRTLVYPVFRNYEACKVIWDQELKMFKKGRIAILKLLIRTLKLIEKGEHRWRLNRLYIEPMICWIQEISEEDYIQHVLRVEEALNHFPSKDSVSEEWCINLLEKYAAKLKQKQNKTPELVDPVKFARSQFNEEDLSE